MYGTCTDLKAFGRRLLAIAAFTTMSTAHAEPQRLGLWVAGDPQAARRIVVELLAEGDVLSGRVERVLDRQGREVQEICSGCPGELADRPMKGVVFITGLRRDGSGWSQGEVLSLAPWSRGIRAACELEIKEGRVHFYGHKFGIGVREVWPAYETAEQP
jgi:hypothetical protein